MQRVIKDMYVRVKQSSVSSSVRLAGLAWVIRLEAKPLRGNVVFSTVLILSGSSG